MQYIFWLQFEMALLRHPITKMCIRLDIYASQWLHALIQKSIQDIMLWLN